MRSMTLIIAATLAASLATAVPGFAAKKAATKSTTTARSFNSCVQLALKRGWRYSDLTQEGTGAQAREFVRNCMAGKQN